MEYRHYHNGEFMFDINKIYNQCNTYYSNISIKPKGLWISIEDSWEHWITNKNFNLNKYTTYTVINIHKADNILFLREEDQFDKLLKEFGSKVTINEFNNKPSFNIYWNELITRYDGMIIDVENDWLYKFGFSMGLIPTNFIEAWDCLSGVIWNLKGADVTIS